MTLLNNKKIVSNSFNNGIDLDSNPMVVSNDCLTNCLNGTLITHNGNEFILQNDMGNGKVESAGLPAGYIPVGMKEFGGIVYVASKNVITGDCQIGSFPSPERNISADEIADFLIPPVPTLSDFCEGDEITNDILTTRIFPNPLKPGDKFKVNIPSNERDLNINYTLGVKLGSGVLKINTPILNVNSEIDFSDSQKTPFNNYEENSKGELYLISEVTLPHDLDVLLVGIDKTKNTIKYEVQSTEQNQLFKYKIDDGEWSNGSLSNSRDDYFYCLIDDISIENKDSITITVAPIIRTGSNATQHDYRVKFMAKTVVTDVSAELSGNVDITQWRYKYYEDDKTLELTFGFKGALDVKNVEFEFYEYNDHLITFNSFRTVEADSKLSYSGLFTDIITALNLYQLYLCKIICYDSSKYELASFYKMVWTNDLLNKYNTSLDNFDSASIELPMYIEGDSELDEDATMTATNDPYEPINTTSSTDPGNFLYTNTFTKLVKFTPKYELQIPNIYKLPFDYSWLERDDLIFKKYETFKNNTHTELGGNPVNEPLILADTANVILNGSNFTIVTLYSFKSSTVQDTTQSKTEILLFYPYFDTITNDWLTQLSRKKIFGHDWGIQVGCTIGTGLDQTSKDTDDIITGYGTVYMDQPLTGGSDADGKIESAWSPSGNRATFRVPDRNYALAERDWENISDTLRSALVELYGVAPTINCIVGLRCWGLNNYDGEKDGWDKTDQGRRLMDYMIHSGYHVHYEQNVLGGWTDDKWPYCNGDGIRNYIIPLWKNKTGNKYFILINSATKADPNASFIGGYGEDINADWGKTIVKPLESLLSLLYVYDPHRSSYINLTYYKSNSSDYSFTQAVSGDVIFKETIDLETSITQNDNYDWEYNGYGLYSPNERIQIALNNFGSVSLESLGLVQINIVKPDPIYKEHTINVPKLSIANIINQFLNPTFDNTTSSTICWTGDDYYTVDDSGEPLHTQKIYYRTELGTLRSIDKATGGCTIKVCIDGHNPILDKSLDIGKYQEVRLLVLNGIFTTDIQWCATGRNENVIVIKDYPEFTCWNGLNTPDGNPTPSPNRGLACYEFPYIGRLDYVEAGTDDSNTKWGNTMPFSFDYGFDWGVENNKSCLRLLLMPYGYYIKLTGQEIS